MRSADELLADPRGAYVMGRAIVVWTRDRQIGVCHVGPLDPADAGALPSIGSCDVLHDLGALEVVDRAAFACLEAYVAWIVARARRVAVVRPRSLAGAVVTGLFHDQLAPRLDARLCADRAEAYAWLDIDDRDELDQICDRPGLLRRVGEEIAARLSTATLETVAQTLATTPRTLQRKLAHHNTTFRDEVMRLRVHAAEAMLLERDDKVEVIAREVGFSSIAAFSAMFHRVAGESPTAFRLRRRTS